MISVKQQILLDDEKDKEKERARKRRLEQIAAVFALRKLYKKAALTMVAKSLKERDLLLTLKKFFSKFSRETFGFYARHGIVPDMLKRRQDLENILNEHYVSTGQKFSRTIRNVIGKPKNDKEVETRLRSRIATAAAVRAKNSAGIIHSTSIDHVHDGIKKTIADAAAEEKILTQVQIARSAARKFLNKTAARITLIALNETQFASESTKDDEDGALSDSNADLGDEVSYNELQREKMWVAILDDRTRPAHAEADGQRVPINVPFIVMGEELMYPGDTSMGASMENIAGCRCSSEIVLSGT